MWAFCLGSMGTCTLKRKVKSYFAFKYRDFERKTRTKSSKPQMNQKTKSTDEWWALL